MSAFGRIVDTPADRDAYMEWAQTRVHRARVERSREIITTAATVGPLVVSSSWGKDSTALVHLACATLGHTHVMHMATAYRLPGWERAADQFSCRATVHEMPPARTLEETVAWLHEVGLGYERAGGAQRITNRAKGSRGADWCRVHGFAVQALGMRAEESKIRRGLLLGRGSIYTPLDGVTRTNPLAWWTVRDVWAYLYAHDVAYHPLYDCETHGYTRETLRNTGWLTTIDAPDGRIAWLRRHYPQQYRALVEEFPRLAQLA